MSLDLERLKKIEDRSKLIVFGYLHDSFGDDIPDLIICACLLFYAWSIMEKECFKVFVEDDFELIEGDNRKIKRVAWNDGTVYGEHFLDPSSKRTYVYKFRVIAIQDDYTITIGIDDKKGGITSGVWYYGNNNTTNYALESVGQVYEKGATADYGKNWVKGDIISMRIDFEASIINWCHNEEKGKDVSISTETEAYRMALYVDPNCAIELVSVSFA